MDPNVKVSFTQNDIKNVEHRMSAFQGAETVAQVHQYFDACLPVNVQIETDTPTPKMQKIGRICFGRP